MARKPNKHKVFSITPVEMNALLEQEMRQLKDQASVAPEVPPAPATVLFPFSVLALVGGKKTEIEYLAIATGTNPGDFKLDVKLGYPDKCDLEALQGWRDACLQQVHDSILSAISQKLEGTD